MAGRLLGKVHPTLPLLTIPRFCSATTSEQSTGEVATSYDEFLLEENVNVPSGSGPLRAWTGDDGNTVGRMRCTVGKVKGKLKVEMRPMEVVHHDRNTKPWKSKISASSCGYAMSNLRGKKTYKEHVLALENYMKKNRSKELGFVQDVNFVHKEFEVGRTGIGAPESIPSFLGVTEEEMVVRLEEMKEAGFSDDEIIVLMWTFPQWAVVQWNNVYPIVDYFTKELKLSLATVAALIEKHPFMFTQNSDQVGVVKTRAQIKFPSKLENT